MLYWNSSPSAIFIHALGLIKTDVVLKSIYFLGHLCKMLGLIKTDVVLKYMVKMANSCQSECLIKTDVVLK